METEGGEEWIWGKERSPGGICGWWAGGVDGGRKTNRILRDWVVL